MMRLIYAFLFLLFAGFGYSQTVNISGTVVDPAGEPLIAATVQTEDGSVGTVTDLQGAYSLDVPEDATIVFSYVGYEPQVFNAGEVPAAVELSESDALLEEVVITGYSQQERRKFSGSATSVSSQAVEDKNTADISEALAGEVAGVQVINANGQPGTPGTIRIRGFGSVNGNRDPLYVVDGAIYNGSLAAINPADIESTTVLKDAVATALYGNRGSNGVIVVTTKKGRKGTSDIAVDFKQGTNFRGLDYYNTILSPEDYVEVAWEGLENAYGPESASQILFDGDEGISPYYNIWDTEGENLIDPSTGQFYSNVNRRYDPAIRRDVFFNPSNRTEANVQLSGGENKTTYLTSFGVLDDVGYFLESNFRRYTGRLNVQHEVKPWLRGSMNLGYGNSKSNFSGQSASSSVNGFFLERMAPPIYDIYLRDPSGNTVEDPIFGGPLFDFGNNTYNGNARRFSSLSNITAVNRYDTDFEKISNLQGQAQLTATFLKNFDFTGRFAYQNREDDADFLTNPYYGQAEGVGDLNKQKEEVNSYTFIQQLSYSKDIGDHSFTINALHENTDYEYKYQINGGTGLLSDPFGTELSNLLTQLPGNSFIRDENLESYLGFADYNFKGKYFLNASIRRDGSSRFSGQNRWGTFPAVGVSWLASEEEFMDADWLNFLKLRVSHGQTGSQEGVGYYRGGDNLFDLSNISGTIPAYPELEVNNSDFIGWETSNQTDFGVEMRVFDRVSAVFDFYNKKTTDLFFDRRVGPSAGYAITKVNDGELLNQGFEFDVSADLVQGSDFNLNLAVNGATLHNELTTAAINPATGLPTPISDEGLFGRAEGYSIFDYYIHEFAGVNPDTGWSMWTQYYDDMNDNGVIDDGEAIADLLGYQARNEDINLQRTTTEEYGEATQFFTGQSAIPNIRGGSRLTVGYKGISLTGQMLYSFGGHGYDGNYQALMDNDVWGGANWHQNIQNRWMEQGDVTDIPKLTNGVGTKAGNANATSTRFLTSSDYLVLNNVRLNYQLPASVFKNFGLENVNIWASGDNLWSHTEREGFFPFVSEVGVTDRETYDPLSNATFGVNFKF